MRRPFFNRALRILLATSGAVMLAGAMLGPIYALFVEEIGGDLLDASLTGSIFALAAGLTTLVAGRIADRVKREELIIAGGYAVMGIGYFLYLLVDSIWTLFAVQVVIGFAEASFFPAYDALYSRHMALKKAGTEWGTWEALSYFATAAGALAGGIIASLYGFPVIFLLMGTLCLLAAFFMAVTPRDVFYTEAT
ncbi:MFS transporter [Candidatus Berkelbacteria bacterium]|nr:MFS transporter [Candidatus Berkelbacteria bacterium]